MNITDLCVDKIVGLVPKASAMSHELEGRFGKMKVGGGFEAGVTKKFFTQSLEACQSYDGWHCVEDWSVRRDCIIKGKRVSRSADGEVQVIKKQRLGVHTLQIVNRGSSEASTNLPTALRIALSDEQVQQSTDDASLAARPDLIRIKNIKRFKTVSGWTIDFARVITSTDPQALHDVTIPPGTDADIDAHTTSFEIEIELVDRTYIEDNGDDYTARSLLMKLCDFLPTTSRLQSLS